MSLLRLTGGVVRTLAISSVDYVARLYGRVRNSGRHKDAVVFLRTDALGDFVVWLRAAELLCERYAHRRRILVINAAWAQLARDLRIWDEVIPVEVGKFRRNLVYRVSTIVRLGTAGVAITINCMHSRQLLVDDALARATCAPVRIASSGDSSNMRSWQKRWSDRVYNKIIPVSGTVEHELVRHQQLLMGLGIGGDRVEVTNLTRYAKGLENVHVRSGGYHVLVPGAGHAGRQWPAEEFAAIAVLLKGAHSLTGVIAGTARDAVLAEQIASAGPEDLVNTVGTTSINDLIALIRDARIVVTNETSATHIAAALGVPCVTVLGGGHFGRFAPYRRTWKSAGALPIAVYVPMKCFGCNWRCAFEVAENSAYPCIKKISLEKVKLVVDGVLRGKFDPLDRSV